MSRRPISNAVSSIIGFGTDAYASYKNKKDQSRADNQDALKDGAATGLSPQHPDPENFEYESYDEDDEGDWLRDETQCELSSYKEEDETNMNQITENMTKSQAEVPTASPGPLHALPVPVIIPERRPGSKHRGFVRAYAPILNDCGIDQTTFIEFLKGFEGAIKASPYFNVVNIAAALSTLASVGAAAVPSAIIHVAAIAVHVSIEAGRRAYMSNAQNKYLDTMNTTLFKPHGLYAMLMTWKPESSSSHPSPLISTLDLNAQLLSAVAARETHQRSNLRATSGKTVGQAQMPESAELVFPLLESAGEEEKANAMKRAGHWVSEWRDRRTRGEFAHENPDSTLAKEDGKTEDYSSRWNDPAHAVNQGSGIIGVLSGGHLGRTARKERRRERLGRPKVEGKETKRTGPLRSAKRKLHENVLYLMVVNMPSEEELQLVAALLKDKKA
ncbi:fad binding domain protein [Rutstroemia sp. NJR-2017a WRK4]|nr:fad binding domain protein [Rutstroemia sp. NJR-2017a WRK4]